MSGKGDYTTAASAGDSEGEEERSPEEILLYSSRHGDVQTVLRLLEQRRDQQISLDVNCKGVNKANLGWTPLHLAAYFGHTDVVNVLLENGAEVNRLNDMGDTALHRASYTGRVESVMLLLRHNADVNLRNSEGNQPKHVAKTRDIWELLEAAGTFEQKKGEEEFLREARDGEMDKVMDLLKLANPPNINCTDKFGNTALHLAASAGRKQVAVLLLQNGISTQLKNHKGHTALDLTSDPQMRQVLGVKPIQALQRSVERFEGPLLKKTRIMGWKPFWVVLDKGVLSMFKTRADATTGTKRKGCKYLDQAHVKNRADVGHIFTVQYADKTSSTFAVDVNLGSTVQRQMKKRMTAGVGVYLAEVQKWENALASHISFATQLVLLGGRISEDEDDLNEAVVPLGAMQDTLQTAEAHHQVLVKQMAKVTGSINALADDRVPNKQVNLLEVRQQLNCLVSTSQEMCASLRHCLTMFTQQEQVRKQQLQHESEKTRVLQESLHVLAEEHLELEKSLGPGHRSPITAGNAAAGMLESDEDEFYDCNEAGKGLADVHSFENVEGYLDDLETDLDKLRLNMTNSNQNNGGIVMGDNSDASQSNGAAAQLSKWGGRSSLPAAMDSRKDFSVWTFLKQCIGKELSKITMPVIFNEPLSFLQRMSEYMEYGTLLQRAALATDPVQRLEYVAAFAVSSAASNWDRVGKPFNPLLGETYELTREDLGFRLVSEQVSHHPPVSAFYVESPQYKFHGSVHPKLKFWGKSVEVTPRGVVTLELTEHNEAYTWQNIICCVHNIIVGKLWIEHYGTMEITNHATGHKAVLNFKPSGWFGKDLHKVEGYIYDKSKKKVRALYGKWVEAMFSHDVRAYEKWQQTSGKSSQPAATETSLQSHSDEESVSEDVPSIRNSSCDLKLQDERLLWEAEPKPAHTEQYYSFTMFAMMLNEQSTDLTAVLPPTDSRLRPDIRKLEQGDLDAASAEKHRLEEKQRAARKHRKDNTATWTPSWFALNTNPHTGKEDWMFTGSYWDKDWKTCPDIF